jgi:hypothetical protein
MQSSTQNLINSSGQQQNYFFLSDQFERSAIILQSQPSYNLKDVDVIADMQKAFHNFVNSGQAWALLIGLFVGYMFRSFTSS